MLHRCDKCGATTRWYDERCPYCDAAQAVEIPTVPIELPRFAPSTRRDDKHGDATAVLTSRSNETPSQPEIDDKQKETATQPQTDATNETPSQPEIDDEQKETPSQPEIDDEQKETPTQPEIDDEQKETPTQPEYSQRFETFWRAVEAWRLAFASETASITIPRERAARYALGIVLELVVCLPCAILAAYFFTRALFADRRADYHEAMLEMEKTRRTLAVGLGVFAAFLCAFIFYVQSQELALPTETGPASQLFKK